MSFWAFCDNLYRKSSLHFLKIKGMVTLTALLIYLFFLLKLF